MPVLTMDDMLADSWSEPLRFTAARRLLESALRQALGQTCLLYHAFAFAACPSEIQRRTCLRPETGFCTDSQTLLMSAVVRPPSFRASGFGQTAQRLP